MARTLNGKCTGMAARIEKRQLREELEADRNAVWLREYNRVARELMDIDPDCEEWFFSRPEQSRGEMYPLMVERLAAMQSELVYEDRMQDEIERAADEQDLRDTQRSILSEFLPF